MAALIEHELAAHNKPNLPVSIVSAQHTVILTSTTSQNPSNISSYRLSQNVCLSVSKIQDGTQGPVSVGNQVPIWMTAG